MKIKKCDGSQTEVRRLTLLAKVHEFDPLEYM